MIDLLRKNIKFNVKTYTMIFALLGIWILFGILTNGLFFSPQNLSNLFRQMTIISFIAIGMVLIIVTGNIDLSVGSVVGFIGVVAAFLQVDFFGRILPDLFPLLDPDILEIISTILTILLCLAAGLLIGVIQGFITSYLAVPSFIVTLGGMMVFRGGVLGVTQGKTIVPINESFKIIAQGYLPRDIGLIFAYIVIALIFIGVLWNRRQKTAYGFEVKPLLFDLFKAAFFSAIIFVYVKIMNNYNGVQYPVILMAIVTLIFSYIASNTKAGRYAYAIGGNKEAARLSGVNVKWNVFKVFMMMGILCGVAGIVLTARVAAGTATGGVNYELSAIASCVIGGTSLMGGEGTILGALVGSLIMASLENGLIVMGIDVFWQYIIKGLVLVLAVYIDVVSKRKK
jgi:D-xylose transport system permease protein